MPKMVGLVMIPPSLYQEIDNLGTLGGFREKEPVMLKCGNLIFGKESLQLAKKFLILLIALEIWFLAASIGCVIALLMLFQTLVVVDLILLKRLLTVLFTELNTVETLVLMPSTTVEIAVLMPFQTVLAMDFISLNTVLTVFFVPSRTVLTLVETASQMVEMVFFMASITELIVPDTVLMALLTVVFMVSQTLMMVSPQFCQMNWNGSVIISKAACSNDPMNWIPTFTTLQMVFQVFWKKVTMPFHRFWKKVDTEVHTSFQLVPNQPRTTSATPLRVLRMFWNQATSPVQSVTKIPFMASQAPDQSPWKTAIKTSTIPRITSKVVDSTIAI